MAGDLYALIRRIFVLFPCAALVIKKENCIKTIKNQLFDDKFNANEDNIIEYLDLNQTKRAKPETRRVNVDFPIWILENLDREAQHLGVARQALIKLWVVQHLPPRM